MSTEGQPKGISAIGKDGTLAIVTHSGVYIVKDQQIIKRFAGKLNYTPTAVAAASSNTEIAVGADVSYSPISIKTYHPQSDTN